jgi:hypothetical protein
MLVLATELSLFKNNGQTRSQFLTISMKIGSESLRLTSLIFLVRLNDENVILHTHFD